MTPKLLIAIDPARESGWAQFKDGTLASALCFELSKPDDRPARRYRQIRGLLTTTLETAIKDGIDHRDIVVAYERASFRGSSTEAAISKGGYYAMIMAVCEDFCIRCEALHVATIKKSVTGSGNAQKELVVATVAEKWGIDPESLDHNAADTIAVGMTMLRQLAAK